MNERQWFDRQSRGQHTDSTHKHVDDYWREYNGLDELATFYRDDWIRRHLFMSKDFWEPDLRRYLEILIERSAGRPVLQFNRVDFRLAWLRANFPNAKIVHLYRHPRDQWLSTLLGDHFPLTGNASEFARFDKFYLITWARDLKHHFPFLDEKQGVHPYQIYYWIWKLSYLFSRANADISVAFEELVKAPQLVLERTFSAVGMRIPDYQPLLDVIERPRLERWREYAPDDWFVAHETECERVLSKFFSASKEPPLAESSLMWSMEATNGETPVRPCRPIR